jgi:hypothetical protein
MVINRKRKTATDLFSKTAMEEAVRLVVQDGVSDRHH